MLTLGDVFAFAAIFVGLAATVWGATVLTLLLARAKTEAAASQIKARPFWSGLLGFAAALGAALAGIIFLNMPHPILKLIGAIIVMAQGLSGVLGAASVASLAAERIRAADPSISLYGALTRSSLLVVALASIPFIGWFLVTPILLSYGAGALFAKKSAPPVAVMAPPAEAS